MARQLLYLAPGLRARGHDAEVVLVCPNTELERDLRAAGVPHQVLRTGGRFDSGRAALRLMARVRRRKPDVVHGYLMPDNLLAALARVVRPRTRVVWGRRSTGLGRLEGRDPQARPMAEAQRLLRFVPNLVISNSEAGRREAIGRGFRPERVVVIENAVDCSRFRPDPEGRERVRAEWGVEPSQALVGMVARISPEKDHVTFLEAAARLAARDGGMRFACVGGDPPPRKRRHAELLRERAAELGIAERVLWPGGRSDMPAVMSAIDLLVLASSAGEGSPNAVAEAMACGTPPVVTDTGDSARLVGEDGVVVPPRDPEALADGCERALAAARGDEGLGARLRARIEREHSIERLVERTERALVSVL